MKSNNVISNTVLLSFCFILINNCTKTETLKPLDAGIIFTVDIPPDSWYYLKNYLKENGVKLTFYIEKYQNLPDSSKQIMREFEKDGHQMAHHTTSHPHANVYIKRYGLEQYMNQEIMWMTQLMNQDGFYPKDFAYPFGDANTQLDKELLKHFNSIRKIVSPYGTKKMADMDLLFYKYDGISIFYGTNIDKRNKNKLKDVLDALKAAKKRREAVSIYCHYVAKNHLPDVDDSYILESDFFEIINLAKQLQLKFYTVKEVSRKVF